MGTEHTCNQVGAVKFNVIKNNTRGPRSSNKRGGAPHSFIYPPMLLSWQDTENNAITNPQIVVPKRRLTHLSQTAFEGKCSLTISEKTEHMSKAVHSKYEQGRYKEMTATSYAK